MVDRDLRARWDKTGEAALLNGCCMRFGVGWANAGSLKYRLADILSPFTTSFGP